DPAPAPATPEPASGEPADLDAGWGSDEEAGGVMFPIADYDELTLDEVMPLLPQLYSDELPIVEERERQTRNRPEVLAKLAELASTGTAADAALAAEDDDSPWAPRPGPDEEPAAATAPQPPPEEQPEDEGPPAEAAQPEQRAEAQAGAEPEQRTQAE